MQMAQKQIKPGQFFSMLILGRLLTGLTFDPNELQLAASDKVICDVLSVVFTVILCVPAFFYMNRNDGLFGCARAVSEKLNRGIAVFYALYFVFWATVTVSRFQVFATSVLVTEIPPFVFILIIIIASFYAAYLGVQALSRASVIFLAVAVASILFLFAISVKFFEPLNLSPIFYDGYAPVLKNAFYSASSTAEITAIMIYIPQITSNVKKGFITTVFAVLTLTLLLGIPTALVLGDLLPHLLFPEYTLATMAEFSMFQNMEASVTAVWILGAFVKTSLMVSLALYCMEQAFKIKHRNLVLAAICVAVSLLSCIFTTTVKGLSNILKGQTVVIIMLVFTVAVPSMVLVLKRKKEMGQGAKI